MRSLPKLIPGVHHKLPGGAQDEVKAIYKHAEEHNEEFNLYIKGEEGELAEIEAEEAASETAAPASEEVTMSEQIKVAYWPGCVSRGFTPELHGSMALVAEKLGIELVELDRANCCGAGVIAEHNQELADTLNARTFALAQQTGLSMMNICSTCQGAQSECQQRLDADSSYRAHVNEVLSRPGPRLREGQGRLHQQELPLAAGRGLRPRPASPRRSSGRSRGLRVGPFYGCYIVRPKERLGYDEFPDRDIYLEQVIEALGGEVVEYDGARKCCGFPVITMNRETSLQTGRHPRRRRDRRRRRLPRHPLPALPPQPRHAAAGGGQGRQPRPRPRRPAPPPAGRPGARRRAEGAGDEQAHRLDRLGRGAPRRRPGAELGPTALGCDRPWSGDRHPCGRRPCR